MSSMITSPTRGGVSFLIGVMICSMVCSTVTAWDDDDGGRGGDEDGGWGGEDEDRGWRGGGDDDDDWEGRRMLHEVPTLFSKMLTAVGMGASFNPSKTSTALPVMEENSLLTVVDTPEMYMVHVKVPGYTAQDTLTVVFEAGTLVIDGQMERVASDCVSGRRLGMVPLCPSKVSSFFTHSVAVPFTSVDGLTSRTDAGVITVSIPKKDKNALNE